MERELANEFEALEDNFDETKKPKLEYNQVQFNKLIKKVLPISFKQFEKQEKNKPIADYITKAYNCYIDRINQVSNIKDILKRDKLTQKNILESIGLNQKTVLNQKDKYQCLLDFINLLNEKYQKDTARILKAYTTIDEDYASTSDNSSTIVKLTQSLIEEQRKNKLYLERINEVLDKVNSSDDINEIKTNVNNILNNL